MFSDTKRGAFWLPTNDLIKRSSISELEGMIDHLCDAVSWIELTYGAEGAPHIKRAQWAMTKCKAMISITDHVNNL